MAKSEKKLGRPKFADPKQVRNREIRIRVNADEEAKLITAGGGNLSTWARELLLRAARRLTK